MISGSRTHTFSILAGRPIFNGRCPATRATWSISAAGLAKKATKKIFRLSVKLEGKDARQKCVSIDTTVQKKNITFPTNLKLAVRIIAKCREMAEKQGIPLRQSYKRAVKQHMLNQRFKDHSKNKKKALASGRKIKTIAGRLAGQPALRAKLDMFGKVLSQIRQSKNKIYSLH